MSLLLEAQDTHTIRLCSMYYSALTGPTNGMVHEAVAAGAFVPGFARSGEAQLEKARELVWSAPVATPVRNQPRETLGLGSTRGDLTPPPAGQCLASRSTPKRKLPKARAAPPSPAPSAASSTASKYNDGTDWKTLV